jgi:hypothetical protein
LLRPASRLALTFLLAAVLASGCTRRDNVVPTPGSPPTASASITGQQKTAAMSIWCRMTAEFARDMMMEQSPEDLHERAMKAAHDVSEKVARQLDVSVGRAAEIINAAVLEHGGSDGASGYCESHAGADATP